MADDNSVEIRFGASTEEALAGIAEVRGALAGLTEPVHGLDGNLRQLAANFGAALPADKVAKAKEALGGSAEQAKAAKAAIEQYQTAAKLANIAYKQTQESLSTQYKLHQITYDQETTALLAALAERHAAEEAAANVEVAALDKKSTAYKHYLDQRLIRDAQYNAERQKILDQQAVQDQKEWENTLKPIQSAWDSQLRKLLGGGESFGKAMKNVFADLVLDIIKKLETLALEKAASGLLGATKVGPSTLLAGLFGGSQAAATTTAAQATASTAATASSAATTTATTATAGGQATSLAANTTALGVLTTSINGLTAVFTGGSAAATAQTTATVAQTTATAADTAATTADTAAVTTDAAATTAETAGSSVGGGGGLLSGLMSLFKLFAIPGFAVGTDYVVSTGIATLHAGETVVPARGSGAFTGAGLGGGDTHVHFNVSAIDAPGVQRFFQSNAEQINRVLRSSLQLNPSQA